MAFTYDLSLITDLAKLRFEIGDTESSGYYLSDEEINATLTAEGSFDAAVITCIEFILRKLSQQDFSADWLRVEHGAARVAWERQLARARRKYGVSALQSGAVHTYRADSLQTETPDYANCTEDDDGQ
jgi:hypothetical protein